MSNDFQYSISGDGGNTFKKLGTGIKRTTEYFSKDISTAFKFNKTDQKIMSLIIKYEGSPEAIIEFNNLSEELSDYAYWFLLSTLWVSYTGYSDLNLWKQLFSSKRSNKDISVMKPSELKVLKKLPSKLTLYRVHRPNEIDWIAYTLDIEVAARFALERKVNKITEYKIKKRDVDFLFLRRGESEIIILDKSLVTKVRDLPIKFETEEQND